MVGLADRGSFLAIHGIIIFVKKLRNRYEMEISYIRTGLSIKETYFQDRDFSDKSCDISIYSCVLYPDDISSLRKCETVLVDVSRPLSEILNDMDPGTRYEIRRAENKDGLVVNFYECVSRMQCKYFCDFYDVFAASKSLKPIFRRRITSLCKNKMAILSEVRNGQGALLVQHFHAYHNSNAALLYSASIRNSSDDNSLRALIGRANRFLHWKDFEFFKAKGVVVYDLGGIDTSSEDRDIANITKFKIKLGGKIQARYTKIVGKSSLGKFILWFLRLFARSL